MAPRVSVIIPTRNEAGRIVGCLEALIAQGAVSGGAEVIVADGGSDDGTAEIAAAILACHWPSSWKVLKVDPGGIPHNLNAALDTCSGSVVVRVDARSRVPLGYLRTVAELLEGRPDLVVVGGHQTALAGVNSSMCQRGIARALNNSFAMGGSRYRRAGRDPGPAETVYLGAFRRADLVRVGGWDERLLANEDFDVCRRLASEGTVWVTDQNVGYIPRSTFISLARQYANFGRWKARYWRLTGDRPLPRQYVALLLPWVAGALFLAVARRRGLVATVVAVVGLAAIDEAGSHGPAGPGERLVAMAAILTVSGSWIAGVCFESLLSE